MHAQMMRRRMDSGLDAGVPSTSGRAPTSSSSSNSTSSRSNGRGQGLSQNKLPNGYSLEDSWDLTDDSGYTPFPVNLPSGDSGMGGNAGAHGMDLWSGSAPALGLHDSREAWGKLGQVRAHACTRCFVASFRACTSQAGVMSPLRHHVALPNCSMLMYAPLLCCPIGR